MFPYICIKLHFSWLHGYKPINQIVTKYKLGYTWLHEIRNKNTTRNGIMV